MRLAPCLPDLNRSASETFESVFARSVGHWIQGLGTKHNFTQKEIILKDINYAGVDVSAKELVVSTHIDQKRKLLHSFQNNAQGYQQLIKLLTKGKQKARVCMEATGVYHFNLALSLHNADDIEVSVVNPRVIKNFADASLQRAKTDKVDANIILDYLERMEFKPWKTPAKNNLVLQALSRRMLQLSDMIIKEKNRLHTTDFKCNKVIVEDINLTIEHIKSRMGLLQKEAMKIITSDDSLKSKFNLITSTVGFAEKTTISLLGELVCMPEDMMPKQWVAHAGLDPRPVESGSSINKARRISRLGNKHLRTALFIPAMVAIRHEPHVKAFYNKLVAAGKKKKQAIIAVMRKLLRAIWGMLNSEQPWNGVKFYSGEFNEVKA